MKQKKEILMEISNIISIEKIKPSSPTPLHLRVYNISLLDRIMDAIYIPVVLYYLGNDCSDKIQHLKESLSRTLITFYPFAGIIRDALSNSSINLVNLSTYL